MAQSLKQALRAYCNLNSDIDDLNQIVKNTCADDKAYEAELKRRTHEYMQTHRIDCLFDAMTGKFVYRNVRSTPRPLSEDMQALVIAEIEKAEREGKLVATDVETLLLDVITMIQSVRSSKTESLKISEKKPASIKNAVEPSVKKVGEMVNQYVVLAEQNAVKAAQVAQVKKDLKEQLQQIEAPVKQYCEAKSIEKKPLNFPRRWSTQFSNCVSTLDPTYFTKVKKHTARRYLKYTKFRARNRTVKSLRPSKKHMKEVLTDLVTERQTGWTHVSIVKTLFKKLYEEAEAKIVQKLQECETTPVFKLSLGSKLGMDDDDE